MFEPTSSEKLIGKPVQVQAIWDDQFACIRFVVHYPDDPSVMLLTDGSMRAMPSTLDKVQECLEFQIRSSHWPTSD